MGVRLFNRSTRSVTLTDQGRRYYDRAKPLVEELDEVDGELTSSTLNIAGQIRIAAAATFGRLHVLPLIPELLSLHPGLQVDLILSDGMRDMVEDRIDLAIRVGPVNEADAIVRRVTGTPLVCVGSRRYFEQHGIPQTPACVVRPTFCGGTSEAHRSNGSRSALSRVPIQAASGASIRATPSLRDGSTIANGRDGGQKANSGTC